MPCRLHRIRMEPHAVHPADRCKIFYRLNRADFIVGIHHAHQRCIRADRSFQHFGQNQPFRCYRQIRHPKPLPFQRFRRVQHRMVLDCRYDNMLFADTCPGCCRHLQRPVICLRTAGGKIYFFRLRMQQVRNFLPRCLHCIPRCPPLFIQGRRVAEVFCHPGQHRLQGCFTQAGGCRLIRIYAHICHPFHFRRGVNTSHSADPGSSRWKDIRL